MTQRQYEIQLRFYLEHYKLGITKPDKNLLEAKVGFVKAGWIHHSVLVEVFHEKKMRTDSQYRSYFKSWVLEVMR